MATTTRQRTYFHIRACQTVHVEVGDTGEQVHAQADAAVTGAAGAQDNSPRCGMPGRGCDQKLEVKHLPR